MSWASRARRTPCTLERRSTWSLTSAQVQRRSMRARVQLVSAHALVIECIPVPSYITGYAGAAVAIDAKGWPDVVVWSPWTSMDCYKHFVCVENASFKPITVEPGNSWRAQTEMDIVDL